MIGTEKIGEQVRKLLTQTYGTGNNFLKSLQLIVGDAFTQMVCSLLVYIEFIGLIPSSYGKLKTTISIILTCIKGVIFSLAPGTMSLWNQASAMWSSWSSTFFAAETYSGLISRAMNFFWKSDGNEPGVFSLVQEFSRLGSAISNRLYFWVSANVTVNAAVVESVTNLGLRISRHVSHFAGMENFLAAAPLYLLRCTCDGAFRVKEIFGVICSLPGVVDPKTNRAAKACVKMGRRIYSLLRVVQYYNEATDMTDTLINVLGMTRVLFTDPGTIQQAWFHYLMTTCAGHGPKVPPKEKPIQMLTTVKTQSHKTN